MVDTSLAVGEGNVITHREKKIYIHVTTIYFLVVYRIENTVDFEMGLASARSTLVRSNTSSPQSTLGGKLRAMCPSLFVCADQVSFFFNSLI